MVKKKRVKDENNVTYNLQFNIVLSGYRKRIGAIDIS